MAFRVEFEPEPCLTRSGLILLKSTSHPQPVSDLSYRVRYPGFSCCTWSLPSLSYLLRVFTLAVPTAWTTPSWLCLVQPILICSWEVLPRGQI